MKVHKKLYKAKKQWCCMALATTALALGMAMAPHALAATDADATTNTSQSETLTTQLQSLQATSPDSKNQESLSDLTSQKNQQTTKPTDVDNSSSTSAMGGYLTPACQLLTPVKMKMNQSKMGGPKIALAS